MKIYLSLLFVFFLLSDSFALIQPVGPSSVYFDQTVRDDWRNTNNLRNLPNPDTTYTVSDSIIVNKNGQEYVLRFYAKGDTCNSASLNQFLHLTSNDSDDIPVEIYFPPGEYYFTEPIRDDIPDDPNYKVNNVIIRGAGGKQTIFVFDLNDGDGLEDYQRDCMLFKYSRHVGIEDICMVRTDDWVPANSFFW
ncbi:MAG: hypothetical protein K9N06_12215 [Candidatus Cloacimonetes bacterium]|nr:hypothetical protein [Candidatus Cloacimonadota bacterium]